MTGNDRKKEKLRPEQYRAIAALVSSGRLNEAAQEAGVSSRTLRRWMESYAFEERLRAAEDELVRASARRLGGLVEKALDVLNAVMADDKAAVGHRLRAAALVLESSLRWREQVALEERLLALEQHAKEKR